MYVQTHFSARECSKIDDGCGFAPDTTGEAYNCLSNLLTRFRGKTP